ncbi:cytochrome P450 family protein [Actinomadura madurae]|uniref:cytochrome P450 family protein n=1 Tax=Actinomadura madurae TaxID=1993 RepID=UPI0020D213E5|nr:cytochrome P450 [Actinomadura madurae]MCP9948084.1 cytochrome P450 [Actinomadura madurae]MCP9977339.1 cytochrome P450 [Actinomadura madurae]
MLPQRLLFSRTFSEDPYTVYAELRESGPVHPIDFPPGATAFLVVDHEHGRAALNDPRLSKDSAHSAVPVNGEMFFGGTMLAMDAPDHTRMRGLVAKAFTARRVERLRPRVEEIAGALLDGIAARGEADLIEDLAVPLPIQVICEMLGVPASDRGRFREWTAVLTVPALTAEARAHRREVARAFTGYLREVIAERRARPEDDLVSALIAARDGDAALTEAEMVNSIGLLLIAGHETTVNLIGNGVLALLRAPGQLDLLRRRPELLPSAVEELLRFDGPLEWASQRIALEDMEIAGTLIPKGAWVHVSLGAADRDPAVFEAPDRLDVTRAPKRHVAFGHGIHFCLGAPLARLEGRIAIGGLLDRFPGLALAVPPADLRHHRTGSIVRGLVSLPVRV